MKIYKTIFILVFILLASACSKEKEVKTSGTHSISSERILEGQTYSYYGFSFSKASVKLYNDASSSDRPDFGVGMNQDSLPYFDTENMEESFALAGDFLSADSALLFFKRRRTSSCLRCRRSGSRDRGRNPPTSRDTPCSATDPPRCWATRSGRARRA